MRARARLVQFLVDALLPAPLPTQPLQLRRARVRVAAALDGAREAVVAALDRPLERVAPGHYVCRVSPARRVAGAVDALALSALVAGVAGAVVGVLRRR